VSAQAVELARQEVGLRCATFLRDAYLPPARAKKIARDVGCSPATAKDWLAGKPPGTPHMLALMLRWRERFTGYVFGPALGWDGYDGAMRRIEDLRREADRLARDLQQLRTASRSEDVERPAPSSSGARQLPETPVGSPASASAPGRFSSEIPFNEGEPKCRGQ